MATKQQSSEITERLTLTTTQVGKAIRKAFSKKRPVFLWGPPGIGKSEVVESIATDLGGHMIDMRMAQMEPTDLRGIPFYNRDSGKMEWAPSTELPDEDLAAQYPVIVLFLDEMNSAPPAVQAAAYQLILNRRLGKYVLPDNVVIIAAGNRDSDKGVTYRMPKPLANRFVHLEMRADFASWQEWAVNKGIHKDVVGFLSFAKQDLYDFDSKSASHAFATPRSWTFVSELLDDEDTSDNETMFNLIAGAVGDGLATKFMAHRKIASEMPNPEKILTGEVKDLKTKEISAMYSLTVSLCYALREYSMSKNCDKKMLHSMMDNYLSFMMANFETELVVMGARTALKLYKIEVDPSKLASFEQFHKKFGKYIINANQT